MQGALIHFALGSENYVAGSDTRGSPERREEEVKEKLTFVGPRASWVEEARETVSETYINSLPPWHRKEDIIRWRGMPGGVLLSHFTLWTLEGKFNPPPLKWR